MGYDVPTLLAEAKRNDWSQESTRLGPVTVNLKTLANWVSEKKETSTPLQPEAHSDHTIQDLNLKQFRAFALVEDFASRVQRQGLHQVPPLLLDISGPAGAGKTAWLKLTKIHINKMMKKDFLRTAAMTGLAASLTGGETLHSLLSLPIGSTRMEPLGEAKLANLRQKFKDVGILVIDEKSTLGQHMFALVNTRLKEIQPAMKNQPFAGFSVILVGDWRQLAPIGDRPLYEPKTKGSQGHQLYRLFTNAISFHEVHRQKGPSQATFRDELQRLAIGRFTRADWQRWKNRAFHDLPTAEKEEFIHHGIRACALKKDMVQHNIMKVKALGTPVALISAEDQPSELPKNSAERSSGLPSHLLLSRGTIVRLTANLWTKAGLVNGAEGIVQAILYLPGRGPPQLPAGIVVSFKNYRGPSLTPEIPGAVPICPILRTWRTGTTTCSRRMIPLLLGYAMSIHKLQGSTCEKVILNAGTKEFASGLMLVGSTRTRTFESLAFDPFPTYERFEQIKKSAALYRRKEEEERLNQLEKATIQRSKTVIRAASRRHNFPLTRTNDSIPRKNGI